MNAAEPQWHDPKACCLSHDQFLLQNGEKAEQQITQLQAELQVCKAAAEEHQTAKQADQLVAEERAAAASASIARLEKRIDCLKVAFISASATSATATLPFGLSSMWMRPG